MTAPRDKSDLETKALHELRVRICLRLGEVHDGESLLKAWEFVKALREQPAALDVEATDLAGGAN